MALSNELISQFVKITNDKPQPKKETTVYGTVVNDGGTTYVKIDGSELLTPVSSTVDAKDGERVTVMIKNHVAIVTGNISSPAARTDDVQETAGRVSEFEMLMAYRMKPEDLDSITNIFDELRAQLSEIGRIDDVEAKINEILGQYNDLNYVMADDVESLNALIDDLGLIFGTFADVSEEKREILNTHITNLKSCNSAFTYVSADVLKALRSYIAEISDKVNVDDLSEFGASIGGFSITEDSIHSEIKDSSGNVIRGIRMSADGQLIFGDENKHVKYYRDEDDNYHLIISADTVLYDVDGKQYSISDFGPISDCIKITDETTNIYGPDVMFGVSNVANPVTFKPYLSRGDSFNVNLRTTGYVSNESKEISFWLPLTMPIIGSPTIAIASANGFIFRQGSKYTHGSGDGIFVIPNRYECELHPNNGLYIKAVFSDITNAMNDDVIGIHWDGLVTLS